MSKGCLLSLLMVELEGGGLDHQSLHNSLLRSLPDASLKVMPEEILKAILV